MTTMAGVLLILTICEMRDQSLTAAFQFQLPMSLLQQHVH